MPSSAVEEPPSALDSTSKSAASPGSQHDGGGAAAVEGATTPAAALPSEETDPKVMDFLRILDEYRLKNEDEGNYAEAERASNQLDSLRKQEIRRQIKALKARQLSERQDIQIAHNLQFAEFNQAWDKYMDEFDQMSQKYVEQMVEKHNLELRQFQEKLHASIVDKPPKFSKELLEWRRRQHMLAKQKNYAEAQKIKRIADVIESKERKRLDGSFQSSFDSKENKFRARQHAEMQALMKRIEVRRKEHQVQRTLDTKRLVQRNRNVQSVLESKQAVEERVKTQEIENNLSRPRKGVFGGGTGAKTSIVSGKRRLGNKK
jgi:hypothetical protein